MSGALQDSVVVVTGASSGIGRATALALAWKGAAVVLAARRADELRELARRAVERFGRIDVWVNNAAVTLFARFEEAPPEAFRQVLETNLFGYVHGARAALRAFRREGRGVRAARVLAPGLYERAAARVTEEAHFLERPAAPDPGNLFAPVPEGTGVSGGWWSHRHRSLGRVALAGLAVAVPVALAVAARRR